MKPFQERDRSVFDPRDYKIETIPTQMSLGVWKKWRHEVEIYVDTIGPSWRGIKLVMQHARHSAVPLAPTVAGMEPLWLAAMKANDGIAPFDPALVDYATKAVTLYRLLVPKLNFDLSTEFRNSAPDNGFELWRLLQRKLDPPRADVEFHLVNDIRKHARTSCANFDQAVRFIAFLESKRREFGVETGTSLDTTVLGEVLGAAMDEDTVGRIEDAGKSIKDYDDCKLFCENRHMRIQSRVAGKTLPKDKDSMVYGVDMPAPPATLTPSTPSPETPPAANPTPPGIDPWASDDPWNCQPCAPEAQPSEQWHLDPFAKGKGKDRPPMACYNSLGLGHPKALCPSPYGAGEQKFFQSARIVVDLVTIHQHAHPEEGLSTSNPKAKERAKTAKARAMEAKVQEGPNGAKGPGEKAKAKCRHLMNQFSGSGAKELKIHSGRQD